LKISIIVKKYFVNIYFKIINISTNVENIIINEKWNTEPIDRQKKRIYGTKTINPLIFWCRRGDLNSHGLAPGGF